MQDVLAAHRGQVIGINFDRGARPRPAALVDIREIYFTVQPVDGGGPIHVAYGEVAEIREGTEEHPRKAGATPVTLVVMLRPPVGRTAAEPRAARLVPLVGIAIVLIGVAIAALLWSRRNQPLIALPSTDRLVRAALDVVVSGLLHEPPRRRDRWAGAARGWARARR
jgi:hypothetical protein